MTNEDLMNHIGVRRDPVGMKLRARAAKKYRPRQIRTLFLCESPPAYKALDRMAYFYFEDNPGNDLLFSTLVEAVFHVKYTKSRENKIRLLRRLRAKKYWLMDAVEYPINKAPNGAIIKDDQRESEMICNRSRLLSTFRRLRTRGIISDRTKVILIKKLVFEVLAKTLRTAKLTIPQCSSIPFPLGKWRAVAISRIRRVSSK